MKCRGYRNHRAAPVRKRFRVPQLLAPIPEQPLPYGRGSMSENRARSFSALRLIRDVVQVFIGRTMGDDHICVPAAGIEAVETTG